MKKESWIIVANSAHARLFKLENLVLEEMDALIHPECRMQDKDLIADKPGTMFERMGQGRSSMELPSAKKHEAVIFAKQIAQHLEVLHCLPSFHHPKFHM